jgi:hypothetical protein
LSTFNKEDSRSRIGYLKKDNEALKEYSIKLWFKRIAKRKHVSPKYLMTEAEAK